MSKDTVDINKGIYQSLVNFFNAKIKTVKYNYTLYGVVTGILGNNQYTVNINNLPCTISAPTIPIVSYKVGDIVLIEVINNDFSFKYIKCLRPDGT